MGEQRAKVEAWLAPLEQKYEKLSRVFDHEELKDVWSEREGRAMDRLSAQFGQLQQLEASLLVAVIATRCPQWNEKDYHDYIDNKTKEYMDKRENDRAVQATG